MKFMRWNSYVLSAAATLCFVHTESLYAWGDVGHMTVCNLAMTQVTPTTKAAIMKITGNQPLNLQCIWPDQVKRVDDWNLTANYHFINYDDGSYWMPTDKVTTKDGQVRTFDNAGDMLQMIEHAKDKLADKATGPKQQLCFLRFLGHLAGDSHQPLHAGRAVDRGGNSISATFHGDPLYRLRVFALKLQKDAAGKIMEDECSKQIFTPSLSCMMTQTLLEKKSNGSMAPLANNLHMMWDDVFIDHRIKEINAFPGDAFENRQTLAAAAAFEQDIYPAFENRQAELQVSMNDDPLKWVEVTNQHRPFAYDTKGMDDSEAYYKSRFPVVVDQVTRAGYHLAGTLNQIFDPAWPVNPYVKEFLGKRKLEFSARLKSGRSTAFKTECDKL